MNKSRSRRSRSISSLFTNTVTTANDGLKIAFFVPMVIMIIIFIQRGIFPFGSESFLRTDMYHQYAPFFSEFQDKLKNGGSLLYSWNIGMGVNFAALYAYYLASPMNWLLLLCPKSLVIEFMTYMIVFKIGLSGLTFAWYLKKHCKTDQIGIGFFGIFYALSGYMAAYSWNIMWLDCILLFPLIIYGLEKLVKDKNGFLYCVTLGLSILSNYYISIMICISMVLYFIALQILKDEYTWKDFGEDCVRFSLYSLLAGALAAAILLPEVFALMQTASSNAKFPTTLTSYFSIFDMIARHLACVEVEIGLDHWPNIYCGVAILMFFLLYLGNQKISGKEKTVYCGLLLIFFASFSTNVLNFIWHGLHYPNSLPSRQSFVYIFLMLFICYRAYMYLEETAKKHVDLAFFGSVSFVLLAEKLVDAKHFHFSVFYVAIIVLAMYAGVIHLYKKDKKGMAIFLALLLVSVEAAANTAVTSVSITSRDAYTKDNEDVHSLMALLEPADQFYRVEKKTRKTKNDGAWMNFPSVSLFSSTANADLTQFFKRMGCEASTNAYSITGSTPLVDSLVSIRYALYSDEVANTDLIAYMKESGSTYLYENLYTLPVGVVLPSDIDNDWQYKMSNPAEVQNDLCQTLGMNDVLVYVDGSSTGTTFTFTTDAPGEYYAYVTNKRVKSVKATLPGETKTFGNTDRGYLLELGRMLDGNQVILASETDNETLSVQIYRFSDQAMIDLYGRMNQTPLQLTKWTDTVLEGTVDCKEKGVLFLSIPYDEGWTVTVDGEEIEAEKIFEAFLSVEVPVGAHEIRLEYFPRGLFAGLLISGGAALILLLLYLVKRRRDKTHAVNMLLEEYAEEEDAIEETHEEINEEMDESDPSEEIQNIE